MQAHQVISLYKDSRRISFDVVCPDRTVRAVVLFLLTVGLALVMCHVTAAILNKVFATQATEILRDFFGLEREGSATTWFSSLQLAMIALVSGLLFVCERASESKAKNQTGWLGFSLLFLFLSLDEAAQIHERLDRILEALLLPAGHLPNSDLLATADGPMAYAYLILYVPVLVVVTILIKRFFASRVRHRATLVLMLAGLAGFALKLGFEPIEAWAGEATWFGHPVMFEIVILQMYALLLGETLILAALLNYLARLIKQISLSSRID